MDYQCVKYSECSQDALKHKQEQQHHVHIPRPEQRASISFWNCHDSRCFTQQSTSSKISSKKMRRGKMRFSEYQQQILLQEFQLDMFPTKERIHEISNLLNLDSSTVKVWYRNRRARVKNPIGGVEAQAIEKPSRYSQSQNEANLLDEENNINRTVDSVSCPQIARKIKSQYKNTDNLSLRDLLNPAPTISQHRPDTSSSESLCSDSASDSEESSIVEKNRKLKIETTTLRSAKSGNLVSGTNEFLSTLQSQIHYRGVSGSQAEPLPNSINFNAESNCSYNAIANSYRYLPTIMDSNQDLNRRNSLVNLNETSASCMQDMMPHPGHSNHKYYTDQLRKEKSVQVQSVFVLPAIQHQQNFKFYDKYSLQSNLSPLEWSLILACDPLEQRRRFQHLQSILSSGCK